MQKNMTPGERKGCLIILLSLNSNSLLPHTNPGYPSQNWRLKMALMPICSLNGASNGARESCYYLPLRVGYFL
jgi:hypothetical protein